MILRPRLKLMLGDSYLPAAVVGLSLVDATALSWCPTAAVDGYYIYINHTFAEQLSEDELTFVLAHELLHCVLGHLDRRGSRDRTLWNIAADYATNGLLIQSGLTAPASVLHDRAFDGHTAEEIYRTLITRPNPGVQSLMTGEPADPLTDLRPGAAEDWAAGRIDRHVDPEDPEGSTIRSAEFPTENERARLRTGLGAELRTKLFGRQAGYFAAELAAGTKPEVPWEELLARFVTGLRRSDYRLFPPNKKHLWRGLYMPSAGAPGPQHLVVAIDTSGSMSDDDLSLVLGEVDALRAMSECELTVLQCDAAIQTTDTFDAYEELRLGGGVGGLHRLVGRGGTDLRIPFQWIERAVMHDGQTVDALIYCTDGYGPMPANEPDWPVMWVVPRHGLEVFPFGSVARLGRDQH